MLPDYSGQNLIGRSFKGQNLEGANFSRADVRGADFTNTFLRGADFMGAKAGITPYFAVTLIVIILLISAGLGVILSVISNFAAFLLSPTIFLYPGDNSAVTLALAAFGVLALAIILPIAFAITIIIAKITLAMYLISVTGFGAIVLATVAILIVSFTKIEAMAVAMSVAIILVLLSSYLSWQALTGHAKFVWIRKLAVDLVAIGGTSFRGSDLTDADFTGSILKSADFRRANLTRTRFYEAIKLDFARLDNTILTNTSVLNLLISCNGRGKSYARANLRGANLIGANLKEADLKDTDMIEATFQGACLEWANLTLAQAVGTNFTSAQMTGACIEAWNIESTTKLDNIDCRFIYLLEHPKPETDDRERRPSSGEFQPREFSKLFEEVLNTVDLIFRNGIDWKAFVNAFQTVQNQNADTELALQSIENKGDGVVVVKVGVLDDADKEKIHSDFTQSYQLALQAVEEKYKAQLQAKDEQIVVYRQQSGEMAEVVRLLANKPINVQIENKVEQNKLANELILKDEIDVNIQLAAKFLEQAGATLNSQDTDYIEIRAILGSLQPYAPLQVLLAVAQPSEHDVSKLCEYSKKLRENIHNGQKLAGIIIYSEPPDPIFRIRIAEVRMRDNFIVIPIPFAAVVNALADNASKGLLAQYTERYLPGADLFNDSNAIGDTLTFFGRFELLHHIEEELCRNQGIGLFGLRKSGKTSLLLQLGFIMRQHPVVHIDLQTYGVKNRYGVELFKEILEQISKFIKFIKKADNETYNSNFYLWDTNCHVAEFATKFAQQINDYAQQIDDYAKTLDKPEYKLPIIVFLDEIERILPTTEDQLERVNEYNSFFGVLRSLSQEKRLISLLVADVHPDCNRINSWPQMGATTNPVFNFFKEVFLSPFSEEETTRMINDIGKLMGLTFDEETISTIYRQSGGYPFTARQLASLLYNRLAKDGNQEISWSAAQRYLKNPLRYSGLLKSYFEENIWNDLKNRGFYSAIDTLKILACNEDSKNKITEKVLLKRFKDNFTENQCSAALLWLEDVGLVSRQELEDEDYYIMRVLLLSRWVQMYMTPEEKQQYQIQ